MCCRVRQACQTGSKAELEECRIMFCDCLNIVVAANLALMDKTHCTADANYVECKDLAPIEKRRQDAILPYDVKFIRKFGSNLVLGTVGWSFALIVYIFGTVSLAYLVVSWIHYKCNLQLFGQSEMPIYEVETVPDEITQTTQTVQH
uniref:Uncharacterized protein n=1 Tax=Panagrolaimus sp. JU765 TaxID=591449 RepID=A0AC34QTN7_9BILA